MITKSYLLQLELFFSKFFNVIIYEIFLFIFFPLSSNLLKQTLHQKNLQIWNFFLIIHFYYINICTIQISNR